jgi:hypothetical protein
MNLLNAPNCQISVFLSWHVGFKTLIVMNNELLSEIKIWLFENICYFMLHKWAIDTLLW